MGTAITILICILCVIALIVLITYIKLIMFANKVKRKAEEFMINKGKDIINDNINTVGGKFQQKLIKEINKKNT